MHSGSGKGPGASFDFAFALAEALGMEKEKLDPVRLALNEAEIRLLETERRLNPEKVAEAKEAVREYPANLTEEQLETL